MTTLPSGANTKDRSMATARSPPKQRHRRKVPARRPRKVRDAPGQLRLFNVVTTCGCERTYGYSSC